MAAICALSSALRNKPMATKKSTPGWSDVKAQLADFDRAGLLGLVKDMYAACKDNQAFLHARFGLGDYPLLPYEGGGIPPDQSA